MTEIIYERIKLKINMKYKLINRTPEEMRCLFGACPAIYELTPKENRCCVGACPSIFRDKDNNYYIVGTQVDPKEHGLAEKVGDGEVLIKVPKELIDKMENANPLSR